MTQDRDVLTRRRFLATAGLVSVGSAAAGAGTAALFNDDETYTPNVSVGVLDLKMNGADATATLLSETDMNPGDSGQVQTTVKNAGTVSGYLDVESISTSEIENGCTHMEADLDSSCADPGVGDGGLGSSLELAATFANGPDLWTGWKTAANAVSSGSTWDLDYTLTAGETDDFVLDWRLPEGTSRKREGDSFQFTLKFHLDDETKNGV